jgi:carbamoyl-phosphate synthase large subunit
MINSNPETVSTDYDTSDKLYFEALTLEDVLNIYELEKPKGVIVQLGGQTPINLCKDLAGAGVRILGTSGESIDITEDRDRFREFAVKAGVEIPPSISVMDGPGARKAVEAIGYPVILRPSYVLGGRAMEIVYDDESLDRYLKEAVTVSEKRPVLVEKFLEDAIEADVDLIGDGSTYVIGAVMEHIEEAGVHSGDSAMVIPTFSMLDVVVEELKDISRKIARKLKIVGLANIQYAIMKGRVYCLEVNPRASRTVPFVSKSIGKPLANFATRVMLKDSLPRIGYTKEIIPKTFSVKESVFTFVRLKGTDIILSPEMRSTGEVMGIDRELAVAFYKSQLASYNRIPETGKVFISVKDDDKPKIVDIAKGFADIGYEIVATEGTAGELRASGLDVEVVRKMEEGEPNIMDLIKQGGVAIMINTPTGKGPMMAEARMRSFASSLNIICVTNIKAARATLSAVRMFKLKGMDVCALQDYHKEFVRAA